MLLNRNSSTTIIRVFVVLSAGGALAVVLTISCGLRGLSVPPTEKHRELSFGWVGADALNQRIEELSNHSRKRASESPEGKWKALRAWTSPDMQGPGFEFDFGDGWCVLVDQGTPFRYEYRCDLASLPARLELKGPGRGHRPRSQANGILYVEGNQLLLCLSRLAETSPFNFVLYSPITEEVNTIYLFERR